MYLTTGDQLNKCKHRNSSRNKQMDDVWFCFSAQIWINTVLFLWMTFSLWVPSVCHNNRNYRLRLCGTTHTVAFRKKIAHKMTLYNIPLKNKIQEIWGRILICHFFYCCLLELSKGWNSVSSVYVWESKKKTLRYSQRNWRYLCTLTCCRQGHAQDKQTEWAWLLQTLFEGKCSCINRLLM